MKSDILFKAVVKSLEEVIILPILFIANIFPDLSIFSFFRSFVLMFMADIGVGTRIKKNIYINRLKMVVIGKNCFINRGVIFDANSKIYVGNNVSIGFNVLITTTEHLEKKKQLNNSKSYVSHVVKIGNGVWIGSNSTILPGCEIGDNCIIGAGAVVKGKLEPNGVYVGVPARYVRKTNGIVPKTI